jgi:hypothetical protein
MCLRNFVPARWLKKHNCMLRLKAEKSERMYYVLMDLRSSSVAAVPTIRVAVSMTTP